VSRIARAVAIRPGEGRLVALAAGAFAAVEAGRGLGEVGVDTLVLSRFGADILPVLYVGLGLVGLVVSLAYGAALSRSSDPRFFPRLLLVLAAVLGVEWLIALAGVEAILPFVWISVYAAGLLLLTAMWTVGGFTFDARQAKRLFPLLTSAAIVGSLGGFLAAIVIQRIVGAEALIAAEAMLFLVAGAALLGLGARIRPRRAPGALPSVRGALTDGAAYVAASPLMRLVAISYVLLAVLLFSLMFPFMAAMEEAFPGEGELLTVLALFSAAVTVASFLVGTLLANRLYARLGIATVAIGLPLVYLLGFGTWLVRFTLTTAVVVRFAQQVTQRGLSNAAFSAFYSVIPSHRRGQVLAFMDGVPGQVGTVLSGVLLIVASSLAMEQVFLIGLVTAVLCAIVLVLARRAYAGSLVATLRAGRAEQVLEGGPGLAALARDGRVIAELRAATTAERASERLLATDLLGRLGAVEAAPELRAALSDPDAGVRLSALRALGAVDPTSASEPVRAALADEDERVRAAAVSLAVAREPSVAAELLVSHADDTSVLVRSEVAVGLSSLGESAQARAIVEQLLAAEDARARAAGLDALARMRDPINDGQVPALLHDPAPSVRAAAVRVAAVHALGGPATLVAALDDPSVAVRSAAALGLRDRPEATPHVLEALRNGSGRTQDAALEALAGHPSLARDPLLGWAEAQVARASALRGHALALDGAEAGSSAAFLASVIARREHAIEGRLLSALAILGAPEASGLIRRCLQAPDPEVRAQAVEALDALGDARLTRGVVRLLERDGEAAATSADVMATATVLADDDDRWVRALALRTLSEHLRAARRTLAERVRDDPDDLVREMVESEPGGDDMPEALPLVNDVDRMLVLRRVPLFEALDPEDLQRVAAAAVEQSWADGDALMVEGELGNELVVIVEGSVRVVHRGEDGEREVRRYGEGDHIGELAVLREAPRAATVLAGDGGVRGLVISGEAIGSLLRERPEAAAAMLATLAERISQQA
jgi:HEAT repeat protein